MVCAYFWGNAVCADRLLIFLFLFPMDKRMDGVLLASDYDGTLCQGGISDEVRQAICRFRDAGGRFGVVSGRDYAGG